MGQSATDIEAYMAANLFYCGRLSARITVQQCRVNQQRDLYLCGSCPEPESAKQPVRRPKQRHKGDNPASPWRKALYNRTALADHEAEQAASAAVEIPEQSESTAPVFIGVDPASGSDQSVVTLVRSGQVRSGQVRSGQVRSGQVRSGQVRSGQVSGAAAPAGDPTDPADNGQEVPQCSSHRNTGGQPCLRK